MVLIGNLLIDLIKQSEKAGEIARQFRRLIIDNDKLSDLLIEEKDEKCKNQRFAVDFKTLADVLIQQTIKYHLTRKYPQIYAIKGEETDQFTNSKGITVNIVLNDNPNDLESLLSQVLIDHSNVAKQLTDVIYEDNPLDASTINESINQRLFEIDLNEDDIGIWIDPIDCTNEYIKSKSSETNQIRSPFPTDGLACVTCLIGVFSKKDGKSNIGVINLPFFNHEQNSYKGKYIWGINYKKSDHEISLNNIEHFNYQSKQQQSNSKSIKRRLILSPAESEEIIDRLKDYELHFISGQGYKLFLLLTNQVDLFLTTRSSTYKWDTAAASAIIKSIKSKSMDNKSTIDESRKNNLQEVDQEKSEDEVAINCSFSSGSLLELKSLAKDFAKNNLDESLFSKYELNYNSDEDLINQNGLIASLDNKLIVEVLHKLKDSL